MQQLKDLWTRYQKKYDYAEDVSWSDVMSAVDEIYPNGISTSAFQG